MTLTGLLIFTGIGLMLLFIFTILAYWSTYIIIRILWLYTLILEMLKEEG